MRGQKHLVKCRCVLPQYKSIPNPPQHHFTVFSVINDDDEVNVKYAQCNNCGIIHKVADICKSEILSGKEAMSSIIKIEDIRLSLPPNLADILERNGAELPSWEQAQFVLEKKMWGEFVILAQEEEAGVRQGKYVRILSETFFKVESFTREEVLTSTEVR
jgi:hypothetical protein